jgi:hypothetical protein
MTTLSELESLSPRELVERLSIRIYEPPLSAARDQLKDVGDALRVSILILDFDTEVSINGILGFLENSTGLYLSQTIDAFERIGARETSTILRAVEATMQRHGITPERLRGDFDGTAAFEITSFAKLHGDLGSFPKDVDFDADRLYLHARAGEGEPVWKLLEEYVEANRKELLTEVARFSRR